MRRLWLAWLALGVCSGCGLGDYEKRMDEQRERLKQRDEENALLGSMLEMPTGKDAYGNAVKLPFEIFLRPPIGIWHKFEGPKAIYDGGKLPLYRYSGKPNVNVFVAMAHIATKSTEKPKVDELLPEDFRTKVGEAICDFIRREYGGLNATFPDAEKFKKETRQVEREGKQEAHAFETTTFDDPRVQSPSRYFVFIHVGRYRQAAVIYQTPVAQADQPFQRTMDISLKTLEITPQAAAMRTNFLNTKR